MSGKIQEQTIPSRDEALRLVAETLEKAIDEYDMLMKADFELVADPTRDEEKKKDSDMDKADEELAEPMAEEAHDEQEDSKDEDEEENEDDKEEDEDEEASDDDVKKGYDFFLSKMYERGLIKSEEASEEKVVAETKVERIAKSEMAAPVQTEDKAEALAKSVDSRFDALTKTVTELTEAISRFANAPAAPRKGLAGYQPLKKNDSSDEKSLTKSEMVEGLLKAQQSGDRRVDPHLVAKVESGRCSASDLQLVERIILS